jgi:hypothetical protein
MIKAAPPNVVKRLFGLKENASGRVVLGTRASAGRLDRPRIVATRLFALSSLLTGDPRVLGIYGPAATSIGIPDSAERERVSVDDIDRNPAANASLFHRATRWLSRYGSALFLGLALLRLWSGRSRGKAPALSHPVLGQRFPVCCGLALPVAGVHSRWTLMWLSVAS